MKNRKDGFLVACNKWTAIAALGTMTVVVLVSVVLRYCFSITIRWTDELTRFVFIYLVFLGIPLAFRKNAHVIIEFFISFLPFTVRKWLGKCVTLAIAVCVSVISISSITLILGKLGKTLSPGLKLPRAFIYAAAPIGFVLLLIEIIRRLIRRDNDQPPS